MEAEEEAVDATVEAEEADLMAIILEAIRSASYAESIPRSCSFDWTKVMIVVPRSWSSVSKSSIGILN